MIPLPRLHPPPPLTEEEKARLEALLGPSLIRQILESSREIEAARLTTHMDMRVSWNYGRQDRAVWSAVHATTFSLRS